MKKSIRDFNLNNKKVIIRVDFNVPMKDCKITDDNRIKMSLKTIKYAIDNTNPAITSLAKCTPKYILLIPINNINILKAVHIIYFIFLLLIYLYAKYINNP